jgi:hypothetical protein
MSPGLFFSTQELGIYPVPFSLVMLLEERIIANALIEPGLVPESRLLVIFLLPCPWRLWSLTRRINNSPLEPR